MRKHLREIQGGSKQKRQPQNQPEAISISCVRMIQAHSVCSDHTLPWRLFAGDVWNEAMFVYSRQSVREKPDSGYRKSLPADSIHNHLLTASVIFNFPLLLNHNFLDRNLLDFFGIYIHQNFINRNKNGE